MVTVPVADVNRAVAFYAGLGFVVAQDVQVDAAHRFVELVPPGSPCSIAITQGYVDADPGSLKGAQFDVDDADRAREWLAARGADVSDVQSFPWGRFCFFTDPDGNEWSVHEAT